MKTAERAYDRELAGMAVILSCLSVSDESPTGLIWTVTNHNKTKMTGAPAGSIDNGYYRVGVHGTVYRNHRLVLWLSGCKPERHQVADHINGNRHDNRFENLRWVNAGLNIANKPVYGSVDYRFVTKRKNRYIAQYGLPRKNGEVGKKIYVGYFLSPEEAHLAAIEHMRNHYPWLHESRNGILN